MRRDITFKLQAIIDGNKKVYVTARTRKLAEAEYKATKELLKNMGLTTDPDDPRLGHGVDKEPIPQHEVYLVLSEEERAKGWVRPFCDRYMHSTCGTITTMGYDLSATYARDPSFYGATYCVGCKMHKGVGEFFWCDKNGKLLKYEGKLWVVGT